eukprot:403340115
MNLKNIRQIVDDEFQLLEEVTETEVQHNRLYMNEEVAHLNRYRDIFPYDDTRVKLQVRHYQDPITDSYINANYVNSPIGQDRRFIASQGPKPNTIGSFWRMVSENNVSLIVTVACEVEGDSEKFEPYWQQNSGSQGKRYKIDNLEIINFERPDRQYSQNLVVREYEINNELLAKKTSVRQIHYRAWPDFGVPSGDALVEFDKMIEIIVQELIKNKDSKIVVHCSAGVGRTGTTIAIVHLIMNLIGQKIQDYPNLYPGGYPNVNIFSTVRKLREQRMLMVQTSSQYQFIYQYMRYWIQNHYLAHIDRDL